MKTSWKFLSSLRRTLVVSVAGLALSTVSASATERVLLGEPSGVGKAALSSPALSATLQELASTAQKNGSVRVIVGVRAAFAPEGKLSAASASQQRNDIASAQAVVLSRLPQAVQQNSTVRRFVSVPYLAMSVTAQELKALEQMPEITSIQKDEAVPATLVNSVPHIGGSTAWGKGYSGAGQVVAVLDTGVEKTHPLLKNKVVAEACYSTTDIAKGVTSVCPGGVGTSTAAGSGLPCTDSLGCSHGTHVAGIVAGSDGSSSAPAGVAKDANIIAMQVFSMFASEADCGVGQAPCALSFSSDQIMALEQVYALRNVHSIAAVNMSLGGGKYTDPSTCNSEQSAIKAVIDSLRSVNIATIIASGNEGYVDALGAPGCISSAISVGSTWAKSGAEYCGASASYANADDISCFSNSANFLNLLAPGSQINSSVLNGLYQSLSGTSMAAPHVAGAWALIKQKKYSASVDEVLNAFVSTGKPVFDKRNGTIKPRIQVDKALDSIGTDGVYTLSVTKSGDGVVTSVPAGINCGTNCAANFSTNSSVTLTATASSGGSFLGWSGACAGLSNVCTVTMSAARSVTANFSAVADMRLIALSKSGKGVVTSAPAGIYCDAACGSISSNFPSNKNIILTATPISGSIFLGWSGACSGTSQCIISAGASTVNVTALFNSSSVDEAVTLLNSPGLSGAASSATNFVVQVPPNATNLVVTTSGGWGDADLYVKYGVAPTRTSYDCVSAESGNAESCGMATPRSGQYHIMLNSFEAYSGVTLHVTYRMPSAKATLSVTKTGAGQGLVQSVSSMAAQMPSIASLAGPSVVGGVPAQSGAWPWQVRLSVTTQQGTFLCGGSLLSDQWVLTAAHCIEDGAGGVLSPANFTVRAGSLQRDSGGVLVGVSRVIKHHAYESATMDNDVALLRLSSPLPLSTTISPIAPLSVSQEKQLAASNTLATVTGWGTTAPGGSTSAVLMQAQVPLIGSSDCANQSAYSSSQLSSNMICAGYPQGGKDSCQGDSGGPLVVPDGRGGYVLAGVVSWGESCAAPDYPGVYARVANYQPWLQAQTQIALGAPLLNCGDACLAIVDTNTTMTLRAQSSNGSNFMGWAGDCSGVADTCTVTVDRARSVIANFSANGFDPLNDSADFVKQQYQDLLGRKPDSATLNDLVASLKSGAVTRAKLIESLMDSDEFRGRLDPVVRLYTAYFKRLPDYEGLTYWVNRMHPGSGMGLGLVQVSDAFAQSNEFVLTYGQLSHTAFISRVYQNVLGRDPEAEGYAYWMGRLSAGMPRGEVMLGFSESAENKQANAQSQLVTTTYAGLLRRAPSAAEHAQWLAEIAAGRATVLNLIDNMLNSSEYAARF
ncbi:MAG: trypsin-like serine protease [Giesbergeria sp.]|nr:trypsin-like serine protease [Giesbergeria sp.]